MTVFSITCQAERESSKEGHEAHGSRKLCAHHHPACLVDRPSHAAFSSPPAATLGSSKSTISTLTATTELLLPGISTLLLNLTTKMLMEISPPFKRMMLKNSPPFKHVWDCTFVERKNSPNGWEFFWCGDVFVPVHATHALFHVL